MLVSKNIITAFETTECRECRDCELAAGMSLSSSTSMSEMAIVSWYHGKVVVVSVQVDQV